MNLLADFLPRHFPQFQAERHVVIDAHVWIERVILENHRDVPVFGRHVVHAAAIDGNLPAADLLQAGQHPQGGGFAASGGTDQHDEFAVTHLKIEVADGGHLLSSVAGEDFIYILEDNFRHGGWCFP